MSAWLAGVVRAVAGIAGVRLIGGLWVEGFEGVDVVGVAGAGGGDSGVAVDVAGVVVVAAAAVSGFGAGEVLRSRVCVGAVECPSACFAAAVVTVAVRYHREWCSWKMSHRHQHQRYRSQLSGACEDPSTPGKALSASCTSPRPSRARRAVRS